MKNIHHYQWLTENLSSSGMPTPEQVKEIAEAGVQVIIQDDLADLAQCRLRRL